MFDYNDTHKKEESMNRLANLLADFHSQFLDAWIDEPEDDEITSIWNRVEESLSLIEDTLYYERFGEYA